MENVPGLVAGKAKAYVLGIYDRLIALGYEVQLFRLNAATMGVPQARERIFIIARKSNLGLTPLQFQFHQKPIYFGQVVDKNSNTHKPLRPSIVLRRPYVQYGDQNLKFADAKYRKLDTCNAFFSSHILYDDVVSGTLTAAGTTLYYNEVRNLNDTEYRRISSFPKDFDFCGSDVRYVCGMSVPPLMMAAIAGSIKEQWFDSG